MGKIRKLTYMLAAMLMAVSCVTSVSDPYAGGLNTLALSLEYPAEYASFLHEGVIAKIEDINLGNRYEVAFDSEGKLVISLPDGLYRISVSDRNGQDIFNATVDRFSFSERNSTLKLALKHTKAGSIVIKEIYCGGCRKDPLEGTYAADKYIILHNNDSQVQYLDSLAFGYLLPYNANATNPFVRKESDGSVTYSDFVAVADAVWQFPGDGHSYPLQPGEDAVLCINGAIDHASSFPLSVDLNKPEYFVTYNANYFPNVSYHPVPGSNIQDDHILNCLFKLGIGNALAYSINSPATVIYKAKGMSLEEFISSEGGVIPVPGTTNGAKVLACPLDWVLDAVEVFNGQSASNVKRFQDTLDAGYVTLSTTYSGFTLMRNVDEELSRESGFEVLMDTNNSSADFHETKKQSLHE